MAGYRIVFNEVKEKVGIDDVARHLGYRVDKRAGIGKYFEMVLGDLSHPTDTIVIKNTPSKGGQTFFRRNGDKGDVLTFIRQNLSAFQVPGNDDWTKVGNVMAQFARMEVPEVSVRTDLRQMKAAAEAPRKFDAARYDTLPLAAGQMPWLLRRRGFSQVCIDSLGDCVCRIRDKRNANFDGYNIGFPYRNTEGEIAGYEIRGNKGFKAKAAGTDCSNSFWSARFPAGCEPLACANVYLFESCFDAIAFHELNRGKLNGTSYALVSTGGSFTTSQIEAVMKQFSAARIWDCFDNDRAGNVYSFNLAKTVDRNDAQLVNADIEDGTKGVTLKYRDNTYSCREDDFDFYEAARKTGLRHSTKVWKAPEGYKDWNDCLLGNRINPTVTATKADRDRNLQNARKSSLKI